MKFLIGIILILICLFFLVRLIERTSLFYPEKEIAITPDVIGLEYKDVFFKSDSKWNLHAWWVSDGREDSKVILFCHGNAGNISNRIEKIRMFSSLGYSVLIFDYRGYGRSDGSPSESGMSPTSP